MVLNKLGFTGDFVTHIQRIMKGFLVGEGLLGDERGINLHEMCPVEIWGWVSRG